jgi:nucleotide-binding universal stress UspA family protein
MGKNLDSLHSAIEDFRKARSQAAMKEILARFRGESTTLLPFDEVRKKLRLQSGVERGLQDIPVDAIVGSVGRYTDFTRDFLPRQDVDEYRWARVLQATTSLAGVPPIEVYKIGDVYFVKDGNHRVSVARSLGATYIQAQVTEIQTRVPITPDLRLDDLIIKAEYAEFLEKTRLDALRKGADLTVTVPGKYDDLLEHIDVHRYYMGIDFRRFIPYDEAVTHWYDAVYMPVIRVIREQGILHYFPDRTETDLYLWIMEHQVALQRELGWEVKPSAAAEDLVSQYSPQPKKVVARLGEKILDRITHDKLEAGPPPGRWRKQKLAEGSQDRMFKDILVPINGGPDGWNALEQAIVVAAREDGAIRGLHVVGSEKDRELEEVLKIRSQFNERCAQAKVRGELTIGIGEVTREICGRASFTDLITINLSHPPAPQTLARLSSGFRDLIRRCSRPILAAPQSVAPLRRALLAYDGSPKAEEALYIATYLAEHWQISLVVITVTTDGSPHPFALEHAEEYLDAHGVNAVYTTGLAPVAEAVLGASDQYACDFLIMGGYGRAPVMEVVLGSSVDQVLRESRKPILICR